MSTIDSHLAYLRGLPATDRHSRYCLDLERLLGEPVGPVPCTRTACVSCGRPTVLPQCAAGTRPWGLCRECMAADGADLRLRRLLVEEAEKDPMAPGPREGFGAMRRAAAALAGRGRSTT